MESKGYIPSEAENFSVDPLQEQIPESPQEAETEPEILPIPAGSVKEQVSQMRLPENTQRALNARVHDFGDISSRITPELMMSVPGMGERSVTQALDTLASYGVRAKVPSENEPVNALGLEHARNDRLKKLGITTFGNLVRSWQDPRWRSSLDPSDAAMIAHRLDRLGLTIDSSP